jgi:cytidylate kinase
MAELIITIDGPAAVGKSTAARLLAENLDAAFLDTGAMYRAVTLAAMQTGADLTDPRQLLEVIDRTDFQFTIEDGVMTAAINGVDITDAIRDPAVTDNVRYIASAAKVRDRLVEMQRQFAGKHKTVVTEGRDQGTVAFPNADFKFFLTAEAAERARRRQHDLAAQGREIPVEHIQNQIHKRDTSDRTRTVGPLTAAEDAIIIDSTSLNAQQTLQKMLNCINSRT